MDDACKDKIREKCACFLMDRKTIEEIAHDQWRGQAEELIQDINTSLTEHAIMLVRGEEYSYQIPCSIPAETIAIILSELSETLHVKWTKPFLYLSFPKNKE